MAGFTQAQLDAIKAAFATGVTRVTYDGKTTEYRSLAEMERIITRIEASLASDAGKPAPLVGYARFRRN